MPRVRSAKRPCLPFLVAASLAATLPASAQTPPPPFTSVIGDNTNVVFVENHIVIDRPSAEVFNFVTTPGNIFKWFAAPKGPAPGITGVVDRPARLGDQTFEDIKFADGRELKLVQTVVVCDPGFEWVVMGQPIGADGKPLPQVLSLAVWTVQSLPHGRSTFSRFFALIGSPGGAPVTREKNPAVDPLGSQAALERLKKYLEGAPNRG